MKHSNFQAIFLGIPALYNEETHKTVYKKGHMIQEGKSDDTHTLKKERYSRKEWNEKIKPLKIC